eukprot:5213140-Alexandrium_andersonii.AAC.1
MERAAISKPCNIAIACCRRDGVMRCQGVLGVPVDAGDNECGDSEVAGAMRGERWAVVGRSGVCGAGDLEYRVPEVPARCA